MKQIRNRLICLWQRILAGILVMLGFSACDSDDELLCMYGSPTADYSLKGIVTDEDGRPVTTGKVIVRNLGYRGKNDDAPDFYKDAYFNDTLKIDGEGKYFYSTDKASTPENVFRVVVEDEGHVPDSVTVTVEAIGGDDGWYMGHGEAVVDFALKKSDEQD